MSIHEARDYIIGLNRRYRQDWERTRMEVQVLHKVQTGKDLDLEFPWEKEEKPEATEEEIERLREKAKMMQDLINKGYGKKNTMADKSSRHSKIKMEGLISTRRDGMAESQSWNRQRIPLTTEEDSDDDYLKPIRSQTGYLRVVDNGDLEGLMPSDNSQHYVELHIDNELEWRGYMQADTFSEDWDVTPLVIEYPLISPIGLLDGVYLDQEKGMGVVMLAELFLECIEATRGCL